MHILYVIRDPFPTNRPDVLTLFGKGLSSRGILSDIVAMVRPVERNVNLTWPGGKCFTFVASKNFIIKAGQIIYHDIRTILRAKNYDAVVVRDRILLAAVVLIFIRNTPVHYWMSFPFPEEDKLRSEIGGNQLLFRYILRARSWVSGWVLYRLVLVRATRAFVQSERMAVSVREKVRNPCPLMVVPMGVDENQLRNIPIAAAELRCSGRFVLTYLGSLDRVRRIDFLLDVMCALKSHPLKFVLLLIGEASTFAERQALVSAIARLGLEEDVVMTGSLPMRDAWSKVQLAQIGLSAIPRGEVFDVSSPTKIVEYLALGIPVVCNDIPDQEQLITATGAGICVDMNVDLFKQAVVSLALDYKAFKNRAVSCREELLSSRGYSHIIDNVYGAIYSEKTLFT